MRSCNSTPIWLENDEPAAFELFNANGKSAYVLIADHASNRVPRCLHQLGLSERTLSSHIAWDAGTASLARKLAQLLDAPLLLSNYSRLVIDCNRSTTSVESILEKSDGVQILGNGNLSEAHVASRARTIFTPYHEAIASLLEARKLSNTTIVSLHSFNPELQGMKRPWSIGVCYGHDTRVAFALLPELRRLTDGTVGDNLPYSIEDDVDFSLPHHAASRGLPHVMLEIRRDKIESAQGALQFATLIHTALLALEASGQGSPSDLR